VLVSLIIIIVIIIILFQRLSVLIQRFNALLLHDRVVDEVAGHSS